MLVCALVAPSLSSGQGWSPNDSITLQIGFGAGGSTDIMGRLVAAKIEEKTGWNVVVENKPGGGGIAMFSTLMRAKPDGLTLGLSVSMPVFLNLASRGDKIPFNIDSFDYLATIMRGEIAMVAQADAPYNTLEELITYAKKQASNSNSSNTKVVQNRFKVFWAVTLMLPVQLVSMSNTLKAVI